MLGRYTIPGYRVHVCMSVCTWLSLNIVTSCSRDVFRPVVEQVGGTVSLANGRRNMRSPAPQSTLSQYRRPTSAMAQDSRRGRLLRAQASEISPPDNLESLVYRASERCEPGHTCHASARKDGQGTNSTTPAAFASRVLQSLLTHGSVHRPGPVAQSLFVAIEQSTVAFSH